MTAETEAKGAEARSGPQRGLLDLLAVERIDDNVFRSPKVVDGRRWFYGGQLAAQALVAAGRTVPEGNAPHSLHGYFVNQGDPGLPVDLRVARVRDGNQFNAREVEIVQDGRVLFTMAASFQRPTAGLDHQIEPSLAAGDPEALPPSEVPLLVSVDCRIAPGAPTSAPGPGLMLASRFWARCTVPLPDDPLVHAAVLTYISDWSSGLVAVHEGPWVPSPSLDHALWFHRPLRLDDWVLVDLVPHAAAGGRGFYTGAMRARTGELCTTIAQEALYGQLKEKK